MCHCRFGIGALTLIALSFFGNEVKKVNLGERERGGMDRERERESEFHLKALLLL